MKCKIPEISWHNRDPVLSVDIQPKTNVNNNYYRLASGGTDAHVLIWYMKLTATGEYGDIELDLAADLTRHQRAVNAVKWSPNGELLASGDDESVVFIWKLRSDSEPINILDATNEQDKEVWITLKVLRGHMEDIYDLSWAPNSLYLVSGSVDNSAMVWDVQKGKSLSILNDHKGFVQGVAWDPKNQYIATLSTDRYLRIFDIQSKKVLYRISKGTLPVSEDNHLHGKRMRLFHDDTLQTFFRRLCFTPDGKLLLTPAGVTDYDGCTRPINTTYAFSRYGFRLPALVLPCPDQYTVAVKCCPILYKLRPFNAEKNPPVVPLPYRMIFAVATKSSVYFYDTQQKQPFALISNIHYTRLTDITWSNDGRIVVVSSTDGFCSLITFEQGELGEEYENSEAVLEAALAQVTKKTKKQKDTDAAPKSRKPSTDDSGIVKENATLQKEPQLEKVIEREISKKEDGNKTSNEEKKNDDQLKNSNTKDGSTAGTKENEDKDSHKAKPIEIKRKPGTVEKKDQEKPTPIAIKRKPAATEAAKSKKENSNDKEESSKTTPTKKEEHKDEQETTKATNNKKEDSNDKLESDKPVSTPTKTNISKVEQKATPIAIKRKPGPIETTTESTPTKTDISKMEQNATPIAIKRKPGPIETTTESTPTKTNLSKPDQKATPIAIKRKPGPIEATTTESTPTKTDVSKVEQKATPIAIKRKPGPVDTADTKNTNSDDKDATTKETTPPKKLTPAIPAKVLAADIIIDKEILSSEEKFESPEKKSRPATPILVRRHPRTPSSSTQTPTTCQTPTTMTNVLKNQLDLQNQSPISSITKDVKTPRQNKKAKPIAIRKTPRAIIATPSVVNSNSMVEEAMDAWPISKDTNTETEESTKDQQACTSKTTLKESGIAPLQVSEATCERTEDMRLVYEETQEETTPKKSLTKPEFEENIIAPETKTDDTPKPQTPGVKTPRRVALKTISTPKSKTETEESTKDQQVSTSKTTLKESGIAPLQVSEATCERTEDIRLVYEETQEETAPKESLPKPEFEENIIAPETKTDDTPKPQTPGAKTPRRVALKTISTPKSKKKLLD